jgi:hypothetical protein
MSQPVSYLQTDPKWAANDYSAKGEKTTIKASGCGPTAMSMVLATWADPKVTPATECAWALAHGYKAPNSGTYYSYFVPAGKRYGLTVTQLNNASIYGNSSSPLHAKAKAAANGGDLVIACMGKGNWTSSGHYVVLWQVSGDTAYINDPASTKTTRTRGSWTLFQSQVKYYWIIQAPKGTTTATTTTTATEEKEEEPMTEKEILATLTDEGAYTLLQKARRHAKTLPEPAWSQTEGHWQRATEAGVVDGTAPEASMKRDEVVALLGRKGVI